MTFSDTKGGIIINTARLEQLRQVDIDTTNKTELIDLNNVKVDGAAPVAERLEQYLSQLKNPYAFRVGEIAVKITFSEDGKSINDAITNYLSGLKESS